MSYVPKTVNGHNLFEVVSALQKAVRRGQVDDALYWAVDMDLSGYSAYLWRRLQIMACEDVGLANPHAAAQVYALWQLYLAQKGTSKKHAPERLMLVQAVMVLATSSKSRTVDNALMVHYMDHEGLYRDIPDYAFDYHTQIGRAKGRGPEHFVEEGARLAPTGPDEHPWVNEGYVIDPYVARWVELEKEGKQDRTAPPKKGQATLDEIGEEE